jgi:hypothetical protein
VLREEKLGHTGRERENSGGKIRMDKGGDVR